MKEKLYLLGYPIGHSKSPVMHNAMYKKLGLKWEYSLMDCADSKEAEEFLKKRDFLGINITSPYKPLAFDFADIKAASAKLAWGANVLAQKNERLIAYNMDGEGCCSFLERRNFDFKGATVVVCGTGPTSLAILHAAAIAGATKLVLIGRNKKRAGAVLRAYVKEFGLLAYATINLPAAKEGHRTFRETYDEANFAFGSYQSIKQAIRDADLVVNATPLGMNPKDKAPIDTELLHEGQTVFDVVYGHGKTALLQEAEARGCQTFDGSGMLVAQAIASIRTFFMVADITPNVSDDEMFPIMARAAGFE